MVDLQQVMDEISSRIEEGASQRAVFGDPVQLGERIVIPVAKVRWGGGGGGGKGASGSGEGGGGIGLGVAAVPVGFIEVTPHGAIFNPIQDPTLITRYVLAGGVAAYLVLRGLRKLFRR
ncbi:MAG: hypothetical protein M3N51_02170 [Actinomycetota bacterium]|nr:hypothetical protein [Actinomycetota bacterium]